MAKKHATKAKKRASSTKISEQRKKELREKLKREGKKISKKQKEQFGL